MADTTDKQDPKAQDPKAPKDEGLIDHYRRVVVDPETGTVMEEDPEDAPLGDRPTDPNRARVAAQRLADANSQASQPRPTMPLGGPVVAPGFLAETSPPLSPLMTEDAAGLAIEPVGAPVQDAPVQDRPVQDRPVQDRTVNESPLDPVSPPQPTVPPTPDPGPSTGEPPAS